RRRQRPFVRLDHVSRDRALGLGAGPGGEHPGRTPRRHLSARAAAPTAGRGRAEAGVRRLVGAAALLVAAAAIAVVGGAGCAPGEEHARGEGDRLRMIPERPATGFARATGIRPFALPRDHGPHPELPTEWWYYTGNLQSADGRHWGYQLTFFRRGLDSASPPPGAGLATNQVYFAHLALTDAAGGVHHFAERYSRVAGGLAGGSGEPFRVWI